MSRKRVRRKLKSFERINGPHMPLNFKEIVKGHEKFARDFNLVVKESFSQLVKSS
ncbi:MAG: hypothetical protein ACOCSA_01420 [Candidatus Hadarchaeota archaeon]